MRYRGTMILFWPLIAIWNMLELVLKFVGRFTAIIIGFVLMIVGVALCITIVGGIAGIPLIGLGFAIMIRGFF